MDSNKKIHLMVDAIKMGIVILIACGLVSLIVLSVSDDPANAFYSFFIGRI